MSLAGRVTAWRCVPVMPFVLGCSAVARTRGTPLGIRALRAGGFPLFVIPVTLRRRSGLTCFFAPSVSACSSGAAERRRTAFASRLAGPHRLRRSISRIRPGRLAGSSPHTRCRPTARRFLLPCPLLRVPWITIVADRGDLAIPCRRYRLSAGSPGARWPVGGRRLLRGTAIVTGLRSPATAALARPARPPTWPLAAVHCRTLARTPRGGGCCRRASPLCGGDQAAILVRMSRGGASPMSTRHRLVERVAPHSFSKSPASGRRPTAAVPASRSDSRAARADCAPSTRWGNRRGASAAPG